ncbi:MAG: SIMPL domain-containing protein [Chloroflexi bacterium]|nr:SIMPL domain-containing protein [Chloroflexota bacterium]
MSRKFLVVLSLLLALVVATQVGCVTVGRAGAGVGEELLRGFTQTGISVSGEGKVTAAPDVATFTVGIESRAKAVADAQGRAATAMDVVMNSLTGNGVDKKDIRTQVFNIRQDRRVDRNTGVETIDYVVTNTVTAKLRKIADVGKIIDAAVKAGGELARVQGISFTVDDPTPFVTQAREKAMADAKAKADQLARLSGVTLGKPVSISESGGAVPPPRPLALPAMAEGARAPAPETPISPGEMEIRASVQIRYTIEP